MIYSYSIIGRRNSNEDQHHVFNNLSGKNKKYSKVAFLSVFDGHGGKLVSAFLKKKLPKYFIAKKLLKIYRDRNLTTKYVKETYDTLQRHLERNHPIASKHSGSTANSVIIYKKNNDNYNMVVINTGDSRSLICNRYGKAKALSQDHKPNTVIEKKRITSLGGKPYYDGSDWRIKDLSVSRAFGDNTARPYVTHRPQIHRYTFSKKDKFIVVACDGLYDACSNQDICNYIMKLKKNNFTGNYAKALCEYGYMKGSYDNISCIVYFI